MAVWDQALGGTVNITVVIRLSEASNTSATIVLVLLESLKQPTLDRKSESTRIPGL